MSLPFNVGAAPVAILAHRDDLLAELELRTRSKGTPSRTTANRAELEPCLGRRPGAAGIDKLMRSSAYGVAAVGARGVRRRRASQWRPQHRAASSALGFVSPRLEEIIEASCARPPPACRRYSGTTECARRGLRARYDRGDASEPVWHALRPSGVPTEERNPRGRPRVVPSRGQADAGAPGLHYFGTTISRGELDYVSDALAAAIHRRGVEPGDRIAISLQNTPGFALSALAAFKVGAIVVPVNPTYRVRELAHVLRDSSARLLIADPALADTVAELLPARGPRRCSTAAAPTSRPAKGRGERTSRGQRRSCWT